MQEFKPTHIYKGNRKEKYNHPCVITVFGTNSNMSIQFEDGTHFHFVGDRLLTKIQLAVSDGKEIIPAVDRNYKPNHYHSGGIDTWAFSEANMSTDKVIGFHLINVLKYVSRHEKKNGLEDLKKAQDSLKEAIRLYEKSSVQPDKS